MGVSNFLVEGVSGTGKTAVCHELQRRGYHAINGDTELAYQGDPGTGRPTAGHAHEHHLWRLDTVRSLVADRLHPVTFFCGGSRNFAQFVELFDGVLVLEVDLETLTRRLLARTPQEWGGRLEERELIVGLHHSKEDLPQNGVSIDATAPIASVVDEVVRQARLLDRQNTETW